MTLVVGYAPDEQGKASLHLAAMLARSSGDEVVVCSVVPAPWVPGAARVDAEYQRFLDDAADHALEQARARMPKDVRADYVSHGARSAPAGLLEAAEQHDARMIVLGPSSAGMFGHIALGSVTYRLLHSSRFPIALATRGFRSKAQARLTRVTAAYGASDAGEDLVVAAAGLAGRVGASMRLASFAVWTRPAYTTRLGTDSEDAMLQEWLKTTKEMVDDVLSQVEDMPGAPHEVQTVVGHGENWAEAIDDVEWDEGDVLVVGSSSFGPVASVFLGSRATKIVRQSPVPVVVVPRQKAAELAESALEG